MKTCKHHWTVMGLAVTGPNHGRLHRHCCKCEADLYTMPTKAELKKHDPTNDLENYSYSREARGYVRDEPPIVINAPPVCRKCLRCHRGACS